MKSFEPSTSANSRRRRLELRIPPVVIALLAAANMWAAARWALPFHFRMPGRDFLGALFTFGGAIVAILGVLEFRRARTTVNPLNIGSVSSLVVSGVYRLTRNPMYLGFFVMLIGVAIWSANAVAFLVLPFFVLVMNRFQIEPEERILRTLFGARFVAYENQVRRWI